MMIILALCVSLAMVQGLPALAEPLLQDYDDVEAQEEEPDLAPGWEPLLVEYQQEGLTRVRRATCGLLSFHFKWFSANNAACAAKCTAFGKTGSTCRNGQCICRGNKRGHKGGRTGGRRGGRRGGRTGGRGGGFMRGFVRGFRG